MTPNEDSGVFLKQEFLTARSSEMNLTMTKDELYEINDAINEVVERMCTRGQTKLEIKHRSLANLWSAWPKLVEQILGTNDTPGLRSIEQKVLENIRRPKILKDLQVSFDA